MVMRGSKRKGVRYFGPYAHAYAIRETLDLLLRTFPIRTCTQQQVRPAPPARPAVPLRHIEKCVGAVRRRRSTTTTTTQLVQELLDFLDGEHDAVVERLETQMREAGRRRSSSSARRGCATSSPRVRKAIERQQMVGAARRTSTSSGSPRTSSKRAVQVFYVRKGRVVGRKGLVVDKVEDVETPELVARVVEQLYADAPPADVPKEILVPVEPDDLELYEEFLALKRGAQGAHPRAAARRQARAARDGDAATRARRSRATSCGARPITTRGPGRWSRCRRRSTCPRRRCASSASTSRTSRAPRSSASMVVMEDGLPKRSDYRRFKVKTARRPGRLRGDGRGAHPPLPQLPPASATKARAAGKRFAYPPNLLLVDGGKGQLGVAVRVLEELGLEDICVASLAKRFEEVYLPGQSRAGAHPARLRGALPAAAGARRGAPLRDHVPPPAARQEDDRVGARRRPRPRARPARPAAQGVRLGEEAAGADRGGAAWRSRGSPTPVGRARVRTAPRRDGPTRDGRDCATMRHEREHDRSTSRSSPACPAPAGPRPRTCSKTSASS